MRTGLVLPVPAAQPLLKGLRDDLPAHVTVLFPFLPWQAVNRAARTRLARVLSAQPPQTVTFAKTGRFPGVLWLEPEPRAPLDAITADLTAAFPACRPYDGQFADPVPHLTLMMSEDEAALDDAERLTAARLAAPLTVSLRVCALYIETQRGWRERLRFALRGSPRG